MGMKQNQFDYIKQDIQANRKLSEENYETKEKSLQFQSARNKSVGKNTIKIPKFSNY